MTTIKTWITGSFMLLVLNVCAAQEPPRKEGRGFGGPPPGGPGQPPRMMFFGPPGAMQNSTISLLAIGEVQKELALTDDQIKQVEKANSEVQQSGFGSFNFQEMENLSPEDREKKIVEMRSNMETASKKADETIRKLLTAKQTARLEELMLQRDGASSLLREDISRQLQLSEKQHSQIDEIVQRSSTGMGRSSLTPQAKIDLFTILTSEQKQQWEKLAGKDFTFPEQPGGPGMMMMRGPGGPPGGGRGGPGGPGGPGGMFGQTRKLVGHFDKDSNGWLNSDERKAARESLKSQGNVGGRGGPGGRGGRGMMMPGGRHEPGKPGPKMIPSDVQPVASKDLYDPKVIRTLFFEFENKDWETELEEFRSSDVDVTATLIVDGKTYPNVGVHFRGMSSYGMVPTGSKRSLNVSLDLADPKQRLYGYKTLNLLNAHEDPTFMHSVLYSQIARTYIPAPKVNFVKVVINGESWGLYANAQQFDKIFLKENYPSDKGTRWKVSGSPGGGGGLTYSGDNIDDYKRRFEIKSGDNEKAWKALIKLCYTLDKTPVDQLEKALEPMLDIEGTLWFLALDNALINGDGYWVRASDYSIYLDEKGKFHILPHDMNEAFQPPMGPGMGGPPGGGPGMGGPGGRGRGGMGPGGGGGPPDKLGGPPGKQGGPPGKRGGPPGKQGEPPPGKQGGRQGEFGPGSKDGRAGGMAGGPGRGGMGGNYNLDPLVAIYDASKPLRSKLLAVPSLRTRYLQHVKTIAKDWLDPEKFGAVVNEYRELIEKEVAADTRKLTSIEEFTHAVETPGERGSAASSRSNLMKFATERRKYLLNHASIKDLP